MPDRNKYTMQLKTQLNVYKKLRFTNKHGLELKAFLFDISYNNGIFLINSFENIM